MKLPAVAPACLGQLSKHYRGMLSATLGASATAGVVVVTAGIFDHLHRSEVPQLHEVVTLVFCVGLVALAEGWQRQQQVYVSEIESQPLRQAVVRAALVKQRSRLQTAHSGQVVSLATDGAERVGKYRGGFRHDLVAALVTTVTLLAAIALTLTPLAAAVLTLVGAVGLAVVARAASAGSAVGKSSRQARAQVANAYLESLQGLQTLALLGATARRGRELAEYGEEQRQATMRLLARNQQILLLIDLAFKTTLLLAAFITASYALATARLTLGQAAALLILTLILTEPVELVGKFFYIAMAGRALERAIKRFTSPHPSSVVGHRVGHSASGAAIAAAHPQAGNPLTPGSEGAPRVSTEPTPATGARTRSPSSTSMRPRRTTVPAAPPIVLDNLSFSYPGNQRQTLAGVSISISAGEHLVIRGDSGSGKSTLLSLLVGELPIQTGTITIGTQCFNAAGDRNGETTVQRRQLCAVVTQDSWLFSTSIRGNLAIANPSANDRQMWQALEQAHLAAEIRALPHGLETPVGERGGKLSGGQIQRLALARAFLSQRPILVLDEPTSHIDETSQAHICHALSEAGRALTVVMTTHTDTTTSGFDRVLTLTAGRQ